MLITYSPGQENPGDNFCIDQTSSLVLFFSLCNHSKTSDIFEAILAATLSKKFPKEITSWRHFKIIMGRSDS